MKPGNTELFSQSKSDDSKKQILFPNALYVYNAAITACEKAKDSKKALELLGEMQARGLFG